MQPKIRYVQICYEYGRKSEPKLEYWDDDLCEWCPVHIVKVKNQHGYGKSVYNRDAC